MKKLHAALLALTLAATCCATALADAGSEPDWSAYDVLIADIRAETDLEVREDMMHHAEEMLMNTGAVLPLYYENTAFSIWRWTWRATSSCSSRRALSLSARSSRPGLPSPLSS